MKALRTAHATIAVLMLCPCQALGQTGTAPPATVQPAAVKAPEKWSLFASAYGYFMPDSGDYLQPTFTADRGRFHFQARYNYEDLDTGSVWLGCNFSGGETVAWDMAPMVGGVFGNTAGMGFGYLGSLNWRAIELVSEGEYVAVADDSSANFTYTWSELTLAPTNWFRFGLAMQNTWAGEGGIVEPGILLGFTYRNVDLAAYLFNPNETERTLVAAVSLEF